MSVKGEIKTRAAEAVKGTAEDVLNNPRETLVSVGKKGAKVGLGLGLAATVARCAAVLLGGDGGESVTTSVRLPLVTAPQQVENHRVLTDEEMDEYTAGGTFRPTPAPVTFSPVFPDVRGIEEGNVIRPGMGRIAARVVPREGFVKVEFTQKDNDEKCLAGRPHVLAAWIEEESVNAVVCNVASVQGPAVEDLGPYRDTGRGYTVSNITTRGPVVLHGSNNDRVEVDSGELIRNPMYAAGFMSEQAVVNSRK